MHSSFSLSNSFPLASLFPDLFRFAEGGEKKFSRVVLFLAVMTAAAFGEVQTTAGDFGAGFIYLTCFIGEEAESDSGKLTDGDRVEVLRATVIAGNRC